MPLRPASRLLRARPRGRLRHVKPEQISTCGFSPSLPTRILVPAGGVRTAYRCASTQLDDAPTAQEQPPSVQALDVKKLGTRISEDEAAIGEFMASLHKCRTLAEVEKLVHREDWRSSTGALKLGPVLRALRLIDEGQKVRWGTKGQSEQFARELCRTATNTMSHMLPRTIANCLHYLHGLGSLDKLVLAKASNVVSKRVQENPTAFKISEMAQICRACSRVKFSNQKLNTALAVNILALQDGQLNPRAVLNILCACKKMRFNNAQVHRCLVCCLLSIQLRTQRCTAACFRSVLTTLEQFVNVLRTILERVHQMAHLAKNVGMLEVYDLGRVAFSAIWCINSCQKEATSLLLALQYAICRQKPNSINAMSAGIMLKDLAIAGVLQPEAAQVLISIVQKEDNIGQSLGAVLQEAAPSLSKMGYQVNAQTPFSDRAAKGANSAA